MPAYAWAYGWTNFLFLCNLGVMITAIALWRGSALLLSTQAVAALWISAAWLLDFSWRLLLGHHLFGATAYMFEAKYPLFTRMLSLYHVAWPILLAYCLSVVGYRRAAWALQAAIAAAAIVVCRLFTSPAANINYAFREPFLGKQLAPGALHVVALIVTLGLGVYGLAHLILRAGFERAAPAPERATT